MSKPVRLSATRLREVLRYDRDTSENFTVTNNARPVRLQLSRAKGFRLQVLSRAMNGRSAVSVARPSKWGNPCRIGMFKNYVAANAVRDFKSWILREPGVRSFENVFGKPPGPDEIRNRLRGRNLACWCAPGAPCHADVLLELSNADED